MKIAMFVNLFAPFVGGTERSVATFAGELRKLGHEVLVATSRHAEASALEAGVLRLPLPRASGPSGPDPLDGFAPDLVHAHHPFLLGDVAFRFAASRGLPLVHTHHTLHARPEDRAALAPLAPLEDAAATLAVAYSDHSHASVVPTGSIASILKEQGVRGELSIVPTGIDTETFARGDGDAFRRRHGLPSDAFLVGHLGRLVPAKRVDFLAGATAAFLAGSPGARALFCGEGERAGALRTRFAEAGVGDRLLLLGELPDAELPDAYAAMDLFVFASLTDTQGIVLLEAMAAGVPVLALRATGPQDLVRDGEDGRLLAPDASEGTFAAAIAGLAGSSALPSFSAAARCRAAAFDQRRSARDLLEVYALAAARARRGGPPPDALDSLQSRVEAEWRRARQAGVPPSLLRSRGFP